MKLRTFDINSRRADRKSKESYVSVNIKGTIIFSQAACSELNVTAGERFFVHQDSESPGDWYFEKTDSKEGIPVRFYNASKTMVLQSARIAREILKSTMGASAIKAKYRISTTPFMYGKTREFYRILTDTEYCRAIESL